MVRAADHLEEGLALLRRAARRGAVRRGAEGVVCLFGRDGSGESIRLTERDGRRDETCPISTGGGTRRVQLVREGGGGGGLGRAALNGAAKQGPAAPTRERAKTPHLVREHPEPLATVGASAPLVRPAPRGVRRPALPPSTRRPARKQRRAARRGAGRCTIFSAYCIGRARCGGGTRRVRLVRGEGRGVSD